MKQQCQVWLISCCTFLAACQSKNVGENLLAARADYEQKKYAEKVTEDANELIVRSQQSKIKYADIRIHPHELPSGEIFLGGWIRVAVVSTPVSSKKKPSQENVFSRATQRK